MGQGSENPANGGDYLGTALVASAQSRLNTLTNQTSGLHFVQGGQEVYRQSAVNAQFQGHATDGYVYPWGYYSGTPIVSPVHYFTGAPKSEAKAVPCGAALVEKTAHGFKLVGLAASTSVDEVTCLGCLRALIPKGKP